MNQIGGRSSVRHWIGRVLFFGYGLYCIVIQRAYLPVNNRSYHWISASGFPAIVFGILLIVSYACLSISSEMRASGASTRAYWGVRGIGLTLAAFGAGYAINVFTPVQ